MKYIEKISIGLFLIVFVAIYIEEWDSIIMFLTTAGTIALILKYFYDDYRFLCC